MAYEHFSSLYEAKESSEIVFADNEIPAQENNHALCKVCVILYLKKIDNEFRCQSFKATLLIIYYQVIFASHIKALS